MRDDHSTSRVSWSPDDGESVATVVGFQFLSWLASYAAAALLGLRDLVAAVVDDLVATGERVPESLAEHQYSGEFRLRIPPALHLALAAEAAEQCVSLSRLLSAQVAQ